MELYMNVENVFVYRIIPQSKSDDFSINDTIPLPMERNDFHCSPRKKQQKIVLKNFSQLIYSFLNILPLYFIKPY